MRGNRGSTPVIIVCSMVILILVSALATDVGYVALERYKLAKTAGNAAKIGAAMLLEDKDAEKRVVGYIVNKVNGLDNLDIDIPENKNVITVKLAKSINFNFLRLFKIKSRMLSTRAIARIAAVCQVKGIRPFAVRKGSFRIGQETVLTNEASEQKGFTRFVPLKLKNGYYKLSVMYGYNGKLNIGDGVYGSTESYPETTVKALKKALGKAIPADDSEKGGSAGGMVILLPVVEKLDSSGASAMSIAGFAAFRTEDAEVVNGRLHIKGRFVRHVIDALTSDGIENFGLLGVELIGR